MEKIVLVDDDASMRLAAEHWLRAAGFKVLSAGDGETGLRLIRMERPRVVLLDLMMPKKHGFAVCQEIRDDPALRGVQVIVASAKTFDADVQKAKELGAAAYLTKPYGMEELLEKVKRVLETSGQVMQVKFWGTRGSIPTPGASTLRYGGNTACVEVRCGGQILMLDCGTGAREMGISLNKEFQGRGVDVHIFISHTHWDHIHGFPFFAPAYTAGSRLTIYSLRGSDKSLERVFSGQMDSSYFPVPLSSLVSSLRFVELEGDVFLGDVRVSHIYLNHPGLAIGFRVEFGPKSLVFVTDHEPYWRLSGDNELTRREEQVIHTFARGADLYIREAQYTEAEYPAKRGWGHSTWADALESAHAARVKSLALFHHDPTHHDEDIDQIVAACHDYVKQQGMQFTCFAARDNLEIGL